MSSSLLLFPDPCAFRMDSYAMSSFILFADTENTLLRLEAVITEYENYQLFLAYTERIYGKNIQVIFTLYCLILYKEERLLPLIGRLENPRRLKRSEWKPRPNESPIYHLVRLLNTLLEPPQ